MADVATPTGLSSAEASRRLAADGPNELPRSPAPSPIRLLAAQLVHFFALMLWVAVALALIAGLPEIAVAIAFIVLLNGVFAFVQETRANRTAEKLAALLPSSATVIRDGHPRLVSSTELVRGDVVLLEAGDRVCADARLDSGDLSVDASMLTGESLPVPRSPGTDVYAGTFVSEGMARAFVTATGAGTRVAGIADMARTAERPTSPLTQKLNRVVRTIALLAISVGGVFFVISLALGTLVEEGFILAIGVTVALVPEGLLPTVTLSLAGGARRMAQEHALVRSLECVETLGATTFLCTDKTGTITRNEMAVVTAWTPSAGRLNIPSSGYEPTPLSQVDAPLAALAQAASLASTGRLVPGQSGWRPHGDPMEVALNVLALRSGADAQRLATARERVMPFDATRRRMSVVDGGAVFTKGSVETVLSVCQGEAARAHEIADDMALSGLRVLAVATRLATPADLTDSTDNVERDLELLGLVGMEDPPHEDARQAVSDLREAAIKVVMVTGDHPVTALAIAREVGLSQADSPVVLGDELPSDQEELGRLVDSDGLIVARATPAHKLAIAAALQRRGHVVAMTGDGVNDGPALSRADVGIALGKSGTDVAREAADLVLLDDRLSTVVDGVQLGRATFLNIRRFLTYHLTANIAELAPFALWGLSGGSYPLILTVLQVLALDVGTDLLPAIALGSEPPSRRVLRGRLRTEQLIDRPMLIRVLGVLGPAEAGGAIAAATIVLLLGGWTWGQTPDDALIALASGTFFAGVVLGQLANAFACRSVSRWVGQIPFTSNRLLLWAVAIEFAMLLVFVGVPAMQRLLGGSWPTSTGWALAALVIPVVIAADTAHKAVRAARRPQARSVPDLVSPG